MKLKIENTEETSFIPTVCVIGANPKGTAILGQFVKNATRGSKILFTNNEYEANVLIGHNENSLIPFLGMNNQHCPAVKFIVLNHGNHSLPKGIVRLPIRSGVAKIEEEILSQIPQN